MCSSVNHSQAYRCQCFAERRFTNRYPLSGAFVALAPAIWLQTLPSYISLAEALVSAGECRFWRTREHMMTTGLALPLLMASGTTSLSPGAAAMARSTCTTMAARWVFYCFPWPTSMRLCTYTCAFARTHAPLHKYMHTSKQPVPGGFHLGAPSTKFCLSQSSKQGLVCCNQT